MQSISIFTGLRFFLSKMRIYRDDVEQVATVLFVLIIDFHHILQVFLEMSTFMHHLENAHVEIPATSILKLQMEHLCDYSVSSAHSRR